MAKIKSGKWRSDGKLSRQNSKVSVKKAHISSPIPLDDEFPIRAPGTGIATPLGADPHERQVKPRDSPVIVPESNDPHPSDVAVSGVPEQANNVQPDPEPIQRSRGPTPLPNFVPPASIRDSTGSVPSGTSIVKPQKKRSGLKSVFGKLFGKKRKSTISQQSRQADSIDLRRSSQHRSDPTALRKRSPTLKAGTQRSTSLPIDEYSRALRSHSIAVEDFPFRDSTYRDSTYEPAYEPEEEHLKSDGLTRPRAATIPSKLWEPSRTPGWTGLSPRPASVHGRGSKIFTDTEANEVGVAVSSGSNPNRRSRSLGELRAEMLCPSTRRRSDEIKYWRQSYDQGIFSPMSFTKPDQDDEPIIMKTPELPQGEQAQPFNFGPMGDMVGMKITQAANLETRVERLEERVMRIERITSSHYNNPSEIVQSQDSAQRPHSNVTTPARPITGSPEDDSLPKQKLHRASPQRHPRHESGGSQVRSSSYGSSRPSTVSNNHNSIHLPSSDVFLSNLFSPDTMNPLGGSQQRQQHNSIGSASTRPLSTSTTIRNQPSSSPTLSKDGSLTSEHYAALTSMIIAEQSARQSLEAVVHNLQRQLHSLLASTAVVPQPRHSSRTTQPYVTHVSNDADVDSSDDGRYERHASTHSVDNFQTPNEEGGRNFGDEIFGGELNRVDGANGNKGGMKGNPRTLSLSQITLGKGVKGQV